MESNEEFVVVNEEAGDNPRETMNQLHVLVDLFSKAVDTLNQSSVLLKDELHTVLSVTLHNIVPDHSSKVEELIKALDNSVTSTDDVRRNYVKRLCARLVSVNEEKQHVMTELLRLNEQLESREKPKLTGLVNEIRAVNDVVIDMEASLNQTTGEASVVQIKSDIKEDVTVDELVVYLSDIRSRLSKLKMDSNVQKEQFHRVLIDGHVESVEKLPASSEIVAPIMDGSLFHSESLDTDSQSTGIQTEADARDYSYTSHDKWLEKNQLRELVRSEFSRLMEENCLLSPLTKPFENHPASDCVNEPLPHTSTNEVMTSQPIPLIAQGYPVSKVSENHGMSSTSESVCETCNVASPSKDVKTPQFMNVPSSSSVKPEAIEETLPPSYENLRVNQLLNESKSKYPNVDWIFGFDGDNFSTGNVDPLRESSNTESRVPLTPSFSVHDEEPWCPGCKQMFASRDELEVHLCSCLT